jgi:H+/gluconate symporter-like permease
MKVSVIDKNDSTQNFNTPSVAASFAVALLPVIIISLTTLLSPVNNNKWFYVLSQPSFALGFTFLFAVWKFHSQINKSFTELLKLLISSIQDIVMILLIIAMGGGFKQVLLDSGVSNYVKEFASSLNYSPLLLAWSVAALLRVSIGSATVAGLTTAGIMLPLISLPGSKPELMVLAIGSGSLMFSHINDTGFWMFKEYFNLSLKQTFLSWTLMETIVSLTGLAGVLILNQLI